jgi:HK97 family phage prohead protease
MRLNHLACRIFDEPLAIEASKLAVILHVLAPRLGIEAPDVPAARLEEAEKRELYSVDDGIAVIDIAGTLVNRAPMGVEAQSGLTSYEEIANDLARAVADESVRGIMLRINSPGGEAAGLMDMARAISSASEKKPVWASADSQAYSAAYWIAAAADQIYVSEDSGVGSIGVIAQHVDQSEWNKNEGLTITTVTAGAHKADFSPHAPLSNEAHQRLQAIVDEFYGMFVDGVARNRKMAKAAVRATEADTYRGQKAIDAGLADKLGGFREAMGAMSAMLASGKRSAPTIIVPRSISDAERRAAARQGLEMRDFTTSDIRSEAGAEPKITGHMAVFGEWSMDLGGFVERLMPGAFSKTIAEADIHDYFNHDSNFVLGRLKSGTLTLREDETGLDTENNPPDTQTIRDLVLEPIRRGDIDQGSIAFRAVRQEWGRQDGVLTRTLHEVRLFHVSPVPRGAYGNTGVGLRSMAELAGLDFRAVESAATRLAMAKHGIEVALSEEEIALMQQHIEALQRCLTVTPGLAAHLTGQSAKPPIDMDTLL